VVTAGDLFLLDVDDQRVSAFRADDVKIYRFGSLGAGIIGSDRCQHVEARIGEKYLFVYNIKVEDVKRSLCAGVSKPASREKQTGSEGLLAEGVFWPTR
jgi:predicted homoserine dehydrogenase-like protein